MKTLIVNLFLLVFLCTASDCPMNCINDPCAVQCLNLNCGRSFSVCARLQACPVSCLELIGDFTCDPECNIPECAWDGLDCGEFCSSECSILNDLSNGKCEEKCRFAACEWDSSDCQVRKLNTCDCSSVSVTSPYEYLVGPGNFYSSLDELFSSELCCEYILVHLEADAALDASGSGLIINSDAIKSIQIRGKTGNINVKIGLGRVLVQGSVFGWEGVNFGFVDRTQTGIATFVVSDGGAVVIDNCKIGGNLYEMVSLVEGTLEVSGLGVSGTVAGKFLFSSQDCGGNCEVSLLGVSITQLNFVQGVVLRSEKTVVSIQNLLVDGLKTSGGVFEMSRSQTNISDVAIKNSQASVFFQVVYLEQLLASNHSYTNTQSSIFQVKYSENCKFSNIFITNSATTSFLFTTFGSNSIFTNTFFSNLSSSVFYFSQSSTTSILNTQLSNIFPFTSAVLFNIDSNLNISSSSFSNTNTSAIVSQDSISIISLTTFENCSSESGAAIQIWNSQTQIIQSQFIKNKSTQQGGAIYISSTSPVTIQNSVFRENQSKSGGAVFTELDTLNSFNNTFVNNSAANGPDMASSVSKIDVTKDFDSVRPGHPATGCVKFTLMDIYNQTAYSNSTSLLAVSIDKPQINSSISGKDFYESTEGVFMFCNLTLLGQPNSTLILKGELYCEGVYCISNPTAFIEVYLEPCSSGEVQSESLNNCVECPEGFYSLTGNETSCQVCPSNAQCYSNKITPVLGYWHSVPTSSDIFKCINPDSCQANGTCATGYTGNLCAVCSDGFTQSTSNSCKQCPALSDNIILLTFLAILFISLICYIIYRTYEDAYEPKLYHSVLIKILMNYFQLMMLTSVLQMRWPQPFYDLISIEEDIGSSTGTLLSADCIIRKLTSADPYYIMQLSSFLAPLALGLIISIVWGIVAIFIDVPGRVLKPLITSLVVVFFILYPGISNNALSILSCYEIQKGEYWNINSLDIQCYTQDYANKYYALFVLSIVLWTVGMPAVGYTMLWKNRTELDDPLTKAKFGFLYHGYHSDRFYWEFIIMLRKILIISAALLLRGSTVSLQLIFVLIVLIGALGLNLYYKPFELYELNRTENFSILLSIICLASGLIIESEASFGLQVLLFIILALSNFLFFCYFAKRVYQAIAHYLWSSFPNIARNICPNAQRPKVKIREILQKEERKNRNKSPAFEPQSGFVDSNKEVIIQLWNMRHFADFYNEVLAARFRGNNIEETERQEQELLENENNQGGFEAGNTVSESRPFFKRLFSRKRKLQTVQQKILNIRRQTLVENTKRRFSEDNQE